MIGVAYINLLLKAVMFELHLMIVALNLAHYHGW